MVDLLTADQGVSVNTVVRERRTLREWTATVSLRTPNFLLHYSDIVAYLESFPPCKLDVSPEEDVIALMSHNRELEIYDVFDEKFMVRARVKVLEERYPEWCLLKFTASGSLLVSTRSNAIIDVFDTSGGYCYSIAVSKSVESFDASSVICSIASVSPSNETTKYLDTLYTLQYNSVFSCYKLGHLAGYISLFKIDLGQSLTTSFVLVPSIDLLIVAGHHRSLTDVEEIDCNTVGLNVYRLVNEDPYVVDVRVSKTQISLCEVLTGWLPLRRLHTGTIISMAANRKYTQLSAISSTGDVFIFDLPSMRLVKRVMYCSGMEKSVQTLWINRGEVAFLTHRGSLLRGKVDNLETFLMNKPEDVEDFDESATVLSPRTGVVFALESKVLSSEGSRSLKNNRAWLAAKLRLTTFYDYIKAYIDAAIGQPLVDVPEAVEKREIKLALHEIRSVTLQHMFKKMLARKDFVGALELTQKYNIEDVDFVYKEQWRQLGDNVNEASVKDVLALIGDQKWVLFECLNSKSLDMATQRALTDLANRLTAEKHFTQRAFVFHFKRIFDIVQSLDVKDNRAKMFLEFRSQSLLDVAIYFAQTSRLDVIEKNLVKNPILRPHLFTILWLVPEVNLPEKYDFLIPYKRNDWFAIDLEKNSDPLKELQALSDDVNDVVERLNYESEVYKRNEFLLKFLNTDELKIGDILEFFKARCFQIDICTGLIELIVDFIQRTISHGFKEMEVFLMDVMFYRDFVVFCGLVSLSLEEFNNSTSDVIFKAIEKHMTEKEVCTNMPRILELLEYLYACGRCSSLEDQLLSFLRSYSKSSLRAVESVQKVHSEWITEELLISCFCTYEILGKTLIESARKTKLPPKYVKLLEAFATHSLEPRFEQLHWSFSDATLARQLLYRLIRSSGCTSPQQWRQLRDDILQIVILFYPDLVTKEEVLRILAEEMLDMNNVRRTRDLIGMILSFDPKATEQDQEQRLSREASLNLLIEKSNDFLNIAMPDFNDPNLRLAREVLTLAPPDCSSRLSKQIKLLDAFDVALNLGCNLLPVQFRHSDFESLLSDIIRINKNYKKLKECAKLAQLLNIRTPVARSMELCAVEALVRRDVGALRKYCEALLKISESQSLPHGIHSLCVDVIRSKLLTDMEEELLTCALLSCPPEDILDTLGLLQERGSDDELATTSYVKPTSELVPDPVYTPIEEYLISDKTDIALVENPAVHVDVLSASDRAAYSNSVANLARHYTQVSSTMALYLSLLLPEETEWTENLIFKKYSQAIRFALKELPFKTIQLLPPLLLIEKYAKSSTGETALQRILNSGCDRERFVEDFRYRDETLKGIAMNTDPQVISDCVEVAEKYRMDVWEICMSAMEYALTDAEVSEESLRGLLSNSALLERLRSEQNRFFVRLRSKTFKALLTAASDNIRIKIYLSFFGSSQPEYQWLEALNSVERLVEGCDFAVLLSDDPSTAASAILPAVGEHSEQVAENLRLLPNGSNICDNAAYIVFSKGREDPNHLCACFQLLEKDTERVIDMIGTLPVSEEISYLEFALKNCIFDENMSSLRGVLEERLQNLRRMSEPPPVFASKSFDASSSTSSLRRRHH